MSALASIAACVSLVAVIWLGLALIGAVREIAELRDRVDALEAPGSSPSHLGGGLAPGVPAPAWSIATPGGLSGAAPPLAPHELGRHQRGAP